MHSSTRNIRNQIVFTTQVSSQDQNNTLGYANAELVESKNFSPFKYIFSRPQQKALIL